jgi:regulatory protein
LNELTPAQLRLAAMNLLARREYSAEELRQKLLQKSSDQDLVKQVIQKLIDDGLQSDERFTQAFTRMRLNQGKGSLKVRLELKQKGIAAQLINAYVKADNDQWQQALETLIQRRFSGHISSDPREKARQLRFLQSRGFTLEQIRRVVSYVEEGN